MCGVCGCGEGETLIEGRAHHHGHDHVHSVDVEEKILAANDRHAEVNRQRFASAGITAINMVSSPGAGKTTLLIETLGRLPGTANVAVIEGDQHTSQDADRIRATGTSALQINTGKGCHLDAHMVGHAAEQLELCPGSLLFIENVGNLVCPAEFDLGEQHRVVILSTTEGEDKPLKYPQIFHSANLMLLNKCDLLPHLQFDRQRCLDYARQVNPDLQILEVSALTGEGMDGWIGWLTSVGQCAARQNSEAIGAG